MLVVAHPGHPLAQRESVEALALSREGQPFWQVDWRPEVRAWHARLAPAEHTITEAPIHTAHDLVQRGLDIALLARSLVAADLAWLPGALSNSLCAICHPLPVKSPWFVSVAKSRNFPQPPGRL